MQWRRVIGTVTLCACVPLLFVGITQPLVHFEVEVKILGQKLNVMKRDRTLMGTDGGLINSLWQESAYLAAGILFTFGVLIPVTKLAFFALWLSDLFGESMSDLLVKHGRMISKWAAVDAVCEALLIGILMKGGPVLAYHKIAFPCFVAYCILSSLAFACLTGKMMVDDPEPSWAHQILARRMQNPRRRVYLLVGSLTMFLVLLGVAGTLQVVRVWMPKEEMAKSIDSAIRGNPALAALNGPNNPIRRQLEESLAARLVDVNASVSGSMERLMSSGHFYTMIGAFFLACTTILAPVMYAVLSVCKALTVNDLSDEQKKQLVDGDSDAHVPWWPELETARGFAHDLSMLDVLLVGTLAGHFAMDGEPYLKSQILPSFAVLVFAAVAWHFHKFLCRAAQICEHAGQEEPGAEPASEPIQG
jgi:uncharacterized paraquat-inducible protein A